MALTGGDTMANIEIKEYIGHKPAEVKKEQQKEKKKKVTKTNDPSKRNVSGKEQDSPSTL